MPSARRQVREYLGSGEHCLMGNKQSTLMSFSHTRVLSVLVFSSSFLYSLLINSVNVYDLFLLGGVNDDSFYYLKTALNLSKGLGSTFDGINPTNGYQPIWLLVLVGLFKVSPFGDDPVGNLYLSIVVQAVFTSAFICILWQFLRELTHRTELAHHQCARIR